MFHPPSMKGCRRIQKRRTSTTVLDFLLFNFFTISIVEFYVLRLRSHCSKKSDQVPLVDFSES